MELTRVGHINDVVEYFKAYPHDLKPTPDECVELTASTTDVPVGDLHWFVWKYDFELEKRDRYPFVNGETSWLMFRRLVKAEGDKLASVGIVFSFDLNELRKVDVDTPGKMAIWVNRGAFFLQFSKSSNNTGGTTIEREFAEFDTKSLFDSETVIETMDSKTPGHGDTAAANG
ncbi:hypothetical protein ACAW74_12815 [Fibrella sp. WM1]|uniref:hypothetical protein n=1 Tax=Fibrella musci TaxID=3242485 RepID=UPI003522B8DB